MGDNRDLYRKKWVEKILLAEKRLFPKILGKIFKDSGGLTDGHRSESRVTETMIYLSGTAVHSRQTTINTGHINKQQTSEKVGQVSGRMEK